MKTEQQLFIGLMSGTSADAIDAVLMAFGDKKPQVIGHASLSLNRSLQDRIALLCTPGGDTLDLLGEVDIQLGELFAKAALALLKQCDVSPGQITAIGSHGQTVRHRPSNIEMRQGFTLQIGDPNIIADRTGITTVADFRRKDMALGGQGAPLVPGFHALIFGSNLENRVVLNLGGIGNITWLPKQGDVLGFDIGPANTLLDYWCHQHTGETFDQEGKWAASGNPCEALLNTLLQHPYLQLPIPKSTGREEFSPEWLTGVLGEFEGLRNEDIQATLTHFSVQCVAKGLALLPEIPEKLFVCGGGAYNLFLLQLLRDCLSVPVATTDEIGMHPQLVEGATFAWLARQTLNQAAGNLPSVTGAGRKAVLGGIYFP